MIYELRTYTCKQGAVGDVAKMAATLGVEIRGDNYGKLEGYWTTDIGTLNQVVHLWSYPDLNARQQLRGELSKNPRWVAEYIPQIYANVVRQDVRLLNQVRGPVAPATTGNLYELRTYRAKPGALKPWVSLFTNVLEAREKYSKIVGLWTGEVGQPNEVCHLWAYPDLNSRNAARAGSMKDAAWLEFLKASTGMLDEMQSTIMLPVAHSPLK